MNLSYKQSVEISKRQGEDRWGEAIYGEMELFNNIELDKRPVFQTIGKKREVKQTAVLTIFEPQIDSISTSKEEWIGARVVDDAQNVFNVENYEAIYDENNNLIKHQLNLIEGRF